MMFLYREREKGRQRKTGYGRRRRISQWAMFGLKEAI